MVRKTSALFALAALFLLAGCATSSAPIFGGYEPEIEEGFVSIFNGENLDGWEGAVSIYGVDPKEPGVLQCFSERYKTVPESEKHGNLVTKKSYRNFVLRFEFCMPTNANNGIGIRMAEPSTHAAYNAMCELQLLDDGGSWYYDAEKKADKLKPWQYTGSIYGIVPSRRDNIGKQIWGKERFFAAGGSYVRRPGMWNFEEIKVVGSEIEVYLNGYLVTKADVSAFKGDGDTPDGKKHPGLHSKEGRIGWLGHGCDVKWRNIRIKELPDDARMGDDAPAPEACPEGFETYFAGGADEIERNWKGVTTEEKFDNPEVRQAATAEKRAEMQAKANEQMREHWHVRNGSLFFDGYKGGYSLATKRDYEDFEIWADWRIMSITGDSGLYLRGSPQVQIWDAHNQWHIGSGGLYNNRTKVTGNKSEALEIADRLVGDWNRFHIIMRGERVWVWLNGKLVVDGTVLENYWNRRRPIFPVEQIELQCHGDPIEWRNIFIRELPTPKIDAARVGVCSWSWRKPLKEVAALMEKGGVKGIHLALGPFIHPDGRHGDAAEADDWAFVKEQVSSGRWNLMSTMIGTVGEDYSTLETIKKTGGIVPDEHWEANKKIVTRGAELTKELGAKYMSLHAGFLDESDKAAKAKFVERVRWMRDEAAKYGVTILLESGQETADDLASFMKEVPGVYINFDPANMVLYNKGNPHEAIRKLFPWIRQIHAKDAIYTAKVGEWGSETPWADGEVRGKVFLKELEDLGYRGNYVVEREGGDRRAEDIALAIERLVK
jgi:sugar phosphate isomerase/epimerase